jgi:hypothetical protein
MREQQNYGRVAAVLICRKFNRCGREHKRRNMAKCACYSSVLAFKRYGYMWNGFRRSVHRFSAATSNLPGGSAEYQHPVRHVPDDG